MPAETGGLRAAGLTDRPPAAPRRQRQHLGLVARPEPRPCREAHHGLCARAVHGNGSALLYRKDIAKVSLKYHEYIGDPSPGQGVFWVASRHHSWRGHTAGAAALSRRPWRRAVPPARLPHALRRQRTRDLVAACCAEPAPSSWSPGCGEARRRRCPSAAPMTGRGRRR